LTVEGIPRNRYRTLKPSEVTSLSESAKPKPRPTHAAKKK
jgi:hypothetical protein